MGNRDERFAGVVEMTEVEAREVVGGPTAVEYAVMLALRTIQNFSMSQPQYYA